MTEKDATVSTWSPEALGAFAADFNRKLGEALSERTGAPGHLFDAMAYSLLGQGKRMRPYLVTCCCRVVGGGAEEAFAAAAAIECVHCFSLVHDDLPAMDDDDLRRGRLTTHKQFDEATAILAGDALLALSFELLVRYAPQWADVVRMVRILAEATGAWGMIGGQAADIAGQNEPPSPAAARFIHERKTARLFSAAAQLGALSGGGEEATVAALAGYGLQLGLAFQVADDVLDRTASGEQLGKATGKDDRVGKQTFPASVGIQESRAAAERAVAAAVDAVSHLGTEAADLRALARYAVSRDY